MLNGVGGNAAATSAVGAELHGCLDSSVQFAGGIQLVQGSAQQGVRSIGSENKFAFRMHIPRELEGIEQATNSRRERVKAMYYFTSRTRAAGAVSRDDFARDVIASTRHRTRETLAVGRRAQAGKPEQHTRHVSRRAFTIHMKTYLKQAQRTSGGGRAFTEIKQLQKR